LRKKVRESDLKPLYGTTTGNREIGADVKQGGIKANKMGNAEGKKKIVGSVTQTPVEGYF